MAGIGHGYGYMGRYKSSYLDLYLDQKPMQNLWVYPDPCNTLVAGAGIDVCWRSEVHARDMGGIWESKLTSMLAWRVGGVMLL